MAKELKKVAKKAKSTKTIKITKATKTTKAKKATKKELAVKDRKKVTGGSEAKWTRTTGVGLRLTIPIAKSFEDMHFASVKEAEKYLLDMGCNRSEARELARRALKEACENCNWR